MLVFVINLDRAPDRLAHMEREFAKAGAAFTRLAATDGQNLDMASEAKEAVSGRPLSKGEIACFLSHRRAWQMLVGSGERHAIILEDDVFLGQGAAAFLQGDGWFPSSAGIVKLETYRTPTTLAKAPVTTFAGRSIHRLLGKHLGAGAYALDRETAAMLVSLSQRIDGQVDDFLFDPQGLAFHGARVHQLTPAICIQGLKLARLRDLDGDWSTYQSHLYAERLATRRRLGSAAKIRRELASAVRKSGTAIVGNVGNLIGQSRWGRVPFN